MRKSVLIIKSITSIILLTLFIGFYKFTYSSSATENVTPINYTGKGVKVAVIDSGVDINHPDLVNNIIGGYDFVDAKPIYKDGDLKYGHGTHVSGIIAANGKIKGVAPEASLLVYRVISKDGTTTDENIVKAIDESIKSGADIINISLRANYNMPNGVVADAINEAIEKGIVVVKSAGNYGPSDWSIKDVAALPGVITVGNGSSNLLSTTIIGEKSNTKFKLNLVRGSSKFPEGINYSIINEAKNDFKSVSKLEDKNNILLVKCNDILELEEFISTVDTNKIVGIIVHIESGQVDSDSFILYDSAKIPVASIDKNDFVRLSTIIDKETMTLKNESITKIFYESSHGPTPGLWGIKPDVIAPGIDINSTVPYEIDESGYKNETGTSMSAPYITGVAALIKQAHKNWSPEQIKAAITNNAKLIIDENRTMYPPQIQGSGFVDIDKLINVDSFITPNNLSFGFIEKDIGKKEITQVLSIENISKNSKVYNIDYVMYNNAEQIILDIPKNIFVEGNSKRELLMNATVDTNNIPNGIYSGYIKFTAENDTKNIPFIILVNPEGYPLITDFYTNSKIVSNQDEIKISYYLCNDIDELTIEIRNLNDDSAKPLTLWRGSNLVKGFGEVASTSSSEEILPLEDGIYSLTATAYKGKHKTELSGNDVLIVDSSKPKVSYEISNSSIKFSVDDLMVKYKDIICSEFEFESPITLEWKLSNEDKWKTCQISENNEFIVPLPYDKFIEGENQLVFKIKDCLNNTTELSLNISLEMNIQ